MTSSYIEVALAVFINSFDMRYDTPGHTMSQVFMCIYIVLFSVYPFWVYYFLRSNYARLEQKDVKDKYWSLYCNI